MDIAQMQYYRKKKGYSYGILAERSGVPLSTVRKIFGGITKTPRYETLKALEEALLADQKNTYLEQNLPEQLSDRVREQHFYNASSNVKKERIYTLADYYALPEERRVELIDGVFYDMSVPTTAHQAMVLELFFEIKLYIRSRNGDCMPYAAPTDVQLDQDDYTMVQPDVFVVCDHRKITEQCVKGAPDLIIEVLSKSTSKKDMTTKLSKYMNAGVREYWLVDLDKERILVYDTSNEDAFLSIYGLQSQVPVGIFEKELIIDFAVIMERLRVVESKDIK